MNKKLFKLVTIVTEPVLTEKIIALCKESGSSGFTVTDVRGEGSGEKSSGEVPQEKVKIEVIVDSELANKITEKISKKYFENYSVIIYTSNIEIQRPEKF